MPVYDFNLVPSNDLQHDRQLLVNMAQLGYDGIAWNIFTNKIPSQKDTNITPYTITFEEDDPLLVKTNAKLTKDNYLTTHFSAIHDNYTPVTASQPSIDQSKSKALLSTLRTTAAAAAAAATTTTTTTGPTISPTISTMCDDDDDENGVASNQSLKTPPLHKPAKLSFQQYSRITLQVDDLNPQVSQLNLERGKGSANSKLTQFDLVAVQPGTEKVLHHFLLHDLCDIVTFDLSKRLPFLLKPQHINMAADKGIFFEINLSPLFPDPATASHSSSFPSSSDNSRFGAAAPDVTARRTFLGQLQTLLHVTRGKQLILCSGNGQSLNCRSRNDLQQLLLAIGAPIGHIVDYTSVNMYHVNRHAKSRKVLKAAVELSIIHKNKPGGGSRHGKERPDNDNKGNKKDSNRNDDGINNRNNQQRDTNFKNDRNNHNPNNTNNKDNNNKRQKFNR